jgi:hypothetical protein
MTLWPRFIIISSTIFTILIFSGIAINYFVDVAQVYRSGSPQFKNAVTAYVDQLKKTPKGLPFPQFEREIKMELVKSTPATCFITGSSHEMKIGSHAVKELRDECDRTLNLAASGGSYEDFVTMAAIVLKKQQSKIIYIGIGPWFFQFDSDSRYKRYEYAYTEARNYFGFKDQSIRTGFNSKLLNLVNGQYLLRNMNELSNVNKIKIRSKVTNLFAFQEDPSLLLPSGSLQSSAKQKSILQNRKNPATNENKKAIGTYKMSMAKPNSNLVQNFVEILEILLHKNIKVYLVLSPYHPSVWDCKNVAVCTWLNQTERQVCDISSRLKIKVIGSYQSAKYNLTWRDFVDSHHVTEAAIQKQWKNGCL